MTRLEKLRDLLILVMLAPLLTAIKIVLASLYNIELACEFLYMASELMLIKSRMLLLLWSVRLISHLFFIFFR